MRYIAFFATLFLLSGCTGASPDSADFACPKTGVIKEASKIILPAGAVKAAVAVEASIDSFSGGCKLNKRGGSTAIDLVVPFTAHKGPAAAAGMKDYEFTYFIALLSADEQILQKQKFSTKVTFDNVTGAGQSSEEHVIRIPVKKPSDAGQYKIAIGFVMPEAPAASKEQK